MTDNNLCNEMGWVLRSVDLWEELANPERWKNSRGKCSVCGKIRVVQNSVYLFDCFPAYIYFWQIATRKSLFSDNVD